MSRLTPEQRRRIAHLVRGDRYTYEEIANRFGVSKGTVGSIAAEIGHHRHKPWTDSEVAFLKQNYRKRGARGCAMVLGRDYSVVSLKARDLGLKTDVGPYGKLRVYKGGVDG